MCFTVMNVGLRLPMYLPLHCLYMFHFDECRIEIAHMLAFTEFICVSPS